MSKMIVLAPLAFVAACAADPQPSVGGDVQVPPAAEVVDPPLPTLYGSYEMIPESCDDHSVMFIAHPFYSDGSSTANVSCLFQFPDGTAVEGCGVTYPMPDPGPVVLVVHDNVSGATATYTDFAQGPASFSLSVDVTTSGDTLTWHAHSLYGSAVNSAVLNVAIDPAANVVETDPALFHQFDGTVHVTADGTYTVTVNGAVDFAEFSACGRFASASVTVDCSGAPSP
jgi:hypothetical protein